MIIDRQNLVDLLYKIGRDQDGEPIQPVLKKVRNILADNVPAGMEPRIKNLPSDRLQYVFMEMQNVVHRWCRFR